MNTPRLRFAWHPSQEGIWFGEKLKFCYNRKGFSEVGDYVSSTGWQTGKLMRENALINYCQ
jgi:hypothetical protein